MAHIQERESLPHLLRELSSEIGLLVRQESALARTEISQKTSRLAGHAGAAALGGGILLAGGLALLAAAIYGLTALLGQFLPLDVAVWLAPLIIGVVLLAIGYARLRTALRAFKTEGLLPHETTESLQEDTQWIKSKVM